jgi:hypothetical protein
MGLKSFRSGFGYPPPAGARWLTRMAMSVTSSWPMRETGSQLSLVVELGDADRAADAGAAVTVRVFCIREVLLVVFLGEQLILPLDRRNSATRASPGHGIYTG